MAQTTEYTERLEQIAHTVFGELSDDQVLQLLAERKQLEALKEQYEQVQKEQEEKAHMQAEKAEIESQLEHLNTLISPDKPDDELIHLVEERKVLEEKLAAADQALGGSSVSEVSIQAQEEKPEEKPKENSVEKSEEEPALVIGKKEEEKPVESHSESQSQGTDQFVVNKDFGEHKIQEFTLDANSELAQYISQMEGNPDGMGKLLEDLPVAAKRDKMFMLAVAQIDPAYAMHYADKDVLKKDEDFNVKVVSMKGKRASGNVLAEMTPEARTEAVVMAAVKQDYKNVRFVLPQMKSYDQILERAKKMALQKVKELKESVDIAVLVPKILQKDKAFMEQVEKLVPKEE